MKISGLSYLKRLRLLCAPDSHALISDIIRFRALYRDIDCDQFHPQVPSHRFPV